MARACAESAQTRPSLEEVPGQRTEFNWVRSVSRDGIEFAVRCRTAEPCRYSNSPAQPINGEAYGIGLESPPREQPDLRLSLLAHVRIGNSFFFLVSRGFNVRLHIHGESGFHPAIRERGGMIMIMQIPG